jgi:hypothetical protein
MVLFSKPILLAGGEIAQIGGVKPFFPKFRASNPSATRCYLAGKPKAPKPIPSGDDETERKRGHIDIPPLGMEMGQLPKKWGGKKNGWIEGYLPKPQIIKNSQKLSL